MAEHITIGDVAPRVQYVADGVLAEFTYPFPIFDAADLEIRIDGAVTVGGATVTGAGLSEGGSVVFDVPPTAGALVTLRRRLRLARLSDFQDNGVLRARTLNDELDYQVAALQQVADDVAGAVRLDPAEAGALVLPARAARANRVLGFDSTGGLAVFERDTGLLGVPFPGGVPLSVEEKLAERLTARDFGATGDGVTDDGPALAAAMAAAAASGRVLEIGEGTFRTTQPLVLGGGAAGLSMRGAILYAGPAGQAALTLGDGAAVRNAAKRYEGLRVLRATISDWENEGDIGLVLRNLDASLVEIRQVEGFTIGIRTHGVERGFEDSTLILGRIVNNRIGLDARTETAAAWNTSVRYYGGHFAIGSTVHPTKDRFGVRLSAAPGAYVAHNRHVFDGPGFELQAEGRPISGIPFLVEVNSRSVWARALRMEGCSPFVARHTGAAQDHIYEVAWASQAYLVDVDYAPSATRVGSVVRSTHQAAAFREASREVASVPNLRAARIRWSNTEWGFERLACLSSNVAGSPSTLAEFAFPALDSFGFADDGVVLTGGRGLGFVVDARQCRDFALAVDADAPRLAVMCFGAARNLLTDTGTALVRASGQSLTWNPTARWYQGAADMLDATLTRPQVVRLAPEVAYAIIGVVRIGTDYAVRAMRLGCDPLHAPALLYGQPTLPHGTRDLTAEAAWDPPSIAAGASAQVNVPLPGARPGDFATAAYSLSTSGVVFLAQVGATDVVTVTAWNRSGGAVDLAAGTVRARVSKA
ncbi:glycosyl hydrolase family 28-related protein [Roseomonas sp. HF4]|uniref:glycosyl hydrolase family 28-related protein n=1 Tax=Roseomonas sp. HF4 TaxID=2562313 RepID=UPI0010C0AEA2|nr:glycosyl hydrolase family 28-related protein [Roseomonas sp. HF4]